MHPLDGFVVLSAHADWPTAPCAVQQFFLARHLLIMPRWSKGVIRSYADPDDLRALSGLICAPQSMIAKESSPAQNGGSGAPTRWPADP